MIEVDWIKTSERLPTREDGDADNKVVALLYGVCVVRDWTVVAHSPKVYPQWARTPEFAPPKVERKLAPEWLKLMGDSWEGPKAAWLYHMPSRYKMCDGAAHAGHFAALGYTHWQPIAEPCVYDEN
jgi:hypothetical protein